MTSVALSNDDKYIISGSLDNSIKIWEYIKSYNDDKYIISGSLNNSIKIYKDNESYDSSIKIRVSEIQTLKGHSKGVNSVAFSNDDKYIISGSLDNSIKIWE